MANLRRTKLKAKRCGCDVKEVDECNSIVEVHKIMAKNSQSPEGDAVVIDSGTKEVKANGISE